MIEFTQLYQQTRDNLWVRVLAKHFTGKHYTNRHPNEKNSDLPSY